MAILYAVVARKTLVLAEFSAVTGNVGAIARRILENLAPESDSRLCFSQDRYIFHVLRADAITFLCMANETFGSASELPAFAFPPLRFSSFGFGFCTKNGHLSLYAKGFLENVSEISKVFIRVFSEIANMVTGDQTLEEFLKRRTFVLEELYFQCVLAQQFLLLLSDSGSFLLLVEVIVYTFHLEMAHYPIHRFRRIPFMYLEDIHMRFMRNYGKVAHSALAYSMNDEFSRVLHQQMEFFSSNPSSDTLNRVRGEVITWHSEVLYLLIAPMNQSSVSSLDVAQLLFWIAMLFELLVDSSTLCSYFDLSTQNSQIHTIMVDNIEKILDRGDRLALLVDKTATMQDSAFHFKKQSRRLRQALWMKNAKLL
ncbi:hypothetical protein ZIOFF_030020 [Zingiber officinale]|uniref:V-SNARE coiled-coil homology domain-containing protein n=1 Tax=Zingiber officinale TaxID=94328 RepID=A0A8J5GXI5_ZINOF|nr:hypothetical protein ZIOFF_030020 [Zingiber officinale]